MSQLRGDQPIIQSQKFTAKDELDELALIILSFLGWLSLTQLLRCWTQFRPNPSQFDATRRDSTLLNATRHTISMKLYEFERPWNVIYSFFYERVNKWGPQNRNWNVGWVYMANMCYGIFIVNESTNGGGGSGGGGDSISTNIIHGGTEQTTQTRI